MTGFGEARHHDSRWLIQVEVRTVNNRHLKLSARISEPYSALEAELEHLIRERVRRGSVQINVRIDRPRRAEEYRLNTVALTSYRDQLRELQGPLATEGDQAAILGAILGLPGVIEEMRPTATNPQDDWPEIARVVGEALDRLEAARSSEGRAMAEELKALGGAVEGHLGKIAERGPVVVQGYHKRLTERVQALVQDQGVIIDPKDLIREIAILADRSDISEEVVRLRAHLAQYHQILTEPDGSGRRLEFVVQEMGREVNTIGSKANDVEISRNVVEIKGVLEKIRELVQNVE
ncbi:MAG: YicC/YloC family endoribonuclease [Isosphaeraceae bacterium]